jgi:hypothetical protein
VGFKIILTSLPGDSNAGRSNRTPREASTGIVKE